jgi:hypothetical protein
MAVNEGVTRLFTATVASAATSSAEVDLGAYFSRVLVNIPAGNTWDTRLLVAADTGGTFGNLYTSISQQFTVASSISNALIPVETVGRFIKVEVSTAAANGASYNIIGIE